MAVIPGGLHTPYRDFGEDEPVPPPKQRPKEAKK